MAFRAQLCILIAGGALLPLVTAPACAQKVPAAPPPVQQEKTPIPPAPPPIVPGSVELDHVVAIVGSNVILQSDVTQELRFSALEPLRVLPGQNTPDRALRRLIDRTLILQQMKEQQQEVTTKDAAVSKAVQSLRKEIPACARYHCDTDRGWEAFLKDHDLTLSEVQARWSQRMAILRFIDVRFRTGIHISQDQIAAYYNKVLVPALAKRHDAAPPLTTVSSRIREILLEQQVSGLLQDWLASLREQGNIRIVDAHYADLDQSLRLGADQEDQSE